MRTEGAWVTQPERLTAITPGTAMWKAAPAPSVGPYLTGQRTVLAGYVYRAQDVRFHNPAEAYLALSLDWEDSEFTPHMSEIYLMAWLARAIDGYAPATGHGVPEFYIEPIAIPVGAGMCRLGPPGAQLVARPGGAALDEDGPVAPRRPTAGGPAPTAWPGRGWSRKPCDTGSWPPTSASPTMPASALMA